MKFSVRQLTFCAAVAAVYAALTLVLAPISFGLIQLRAAEALCVLPFFVPETAWGLFVGCLISNIFGGFGVPDMVFGSLATLVSAWLTSRIRNRPLACLPPVVMNAVVIGCVLTAELTETNFLRTFALNAATIALGEAGAMFCLGLPLMYLLPKWKFFRNIISGLSGR